MTLHLEGERFGRLSVIRRGKTIGNRYYWECKCDCGNILDVRVDSLRSGKTNSCGCLLRETNVKRLTTHNASRSYTYKSWNSMNNRVKEDPRYKGITVCERWSSFENFLEDMGERPEGMSLDRYPNQKGNYEPGNCRWATITEQQNNKSNNIVLNYKGETHTLGEWSRILEVKYHVLKNRYRRNLPVERILHKGKLNKQSCLDIAPPMKEKN